MSDVVVAGNERATIFDCIENLQIILNNTQKGLLHCLLINHGGSMQRTALYELLLGKRKALYWSIALDGKQIKNHLAYNKSELQVSGFYYQPWEQPSNPLISGEPMQTSLLLAMGYWPTDQQGIKKLEGILEAMELSSDYEKTMKIVWWEKEWVWWEIFTKTMLSWLALMRNDEESYQWWRMLHTYMRKRVPFLPIWWAKEITSNKKKPKLLIAGEPEAMNYNLGEYRTAINFFRQHGINIFHVGCSLPDDTDYVHYYPDTLSGRYINTLSFDNHQLTKKKVADFVYNHDAKYFMPSEKPESINFFSGVDAKKTWRWLEQETLSWNQKKYGLEANNYTKLFTLKDVSLQKNSLKDVLWAAFPYGDKPENVEQMRGVPLASVQWSLEYLNLCYSDVPQWGNFSWNLFITVEGIRHLIEWTLEYHHIRLERFGVHGDNVSFNDTTDKSSWPEKHFWRVHKYISVIQLKRLLCNYLFDFLQLREVFDKEYHEQKASLLFTTANAKTVVAKQKNSVKHSLQQWKIPGSEFYKYSSVVKAYESLRQTESYQKYMVIPEYKLVTKVMKESVLSGQKQLIVEIGHGDGELIKQISQENEQIKNIPKAFFDESIMMGMALRKNIARDELHYTAYNSNYFDATQIHAQNNKAILICGLLHNMSVKNGELQQFLQKIYQTMHGTDELILALPGEQTKEMIQKIYSSDILIEAFSQEVVQGKPPYGEVMKREMSFDEQQKMYQAKIKILKPFTYQLGYNETIDVPAGVLHGIPSRREGPDFYSNYLLQAGFTQKNIVVYYDQKTKYLVLRCIK